MQLYVKVCVIKTRLLGFFPSAGGLQTVVFLRKC